METSEKEVDFLRFQRRVNTLLGMPFYVNSTEKLGRKFGLILTAFHQFFTEVIVVSKFSNTVIVSESLQFAQILIPPWLLPSISCFCHIFGITIIVTIGQFWAIPHIYEDMNVLCSCLSSGSHSAQVVAKITLLKCCKSLYLAHIKTAHSLQKSSDYFERLFLQRDSSFMKYHQRQTKYINIIVLVQLLVNFVSTSAYFLPFVYDSIVNEAEVKNQLTPIVVYIPRDINTTPLFQIVVVTLTVGFYTINLKTVVIDNFLLNLIALHMSQLKYHNELLKEVIQKETTEDAESRDMMKGWIKQHQALSSMCNDFRRLISSYLFIEFFYVFIHTCVPSFVITSTLSWTLPQKVAVFCMVGGGLVEVFLMCSAGGVFSDVWQSTGNTILRSDYVFKGGKWMKDVFVMIQLNSQKNFHLSAFNVIPLNRGTFASILRLIFSYYITLNQIQRLKHHD